MPKNNPRCFKCQRYGHVLSDCTNRRVITLAECKSFQEEEKEGSVEEGREGEVEESHEEVIKHIDEGELLMVKRVLIGLLTIEEEPKEESFPPEEETTHISTPLPPFKLL